MLGNIIVTLVVVIRYHYHYDGDNNFCDLEECQRGFFKMEQTEKTDQLKSQQK